MYKRSTTTDSPRYFTQRLVVAALGLIALFTVLAPDSSQPLPFWPRLGFWSLHIGLGLATAELAARFLIQRFQGLNDWRLVVWSGLLGVTMFAPVAFALESLFPLSNAEPDGDWSDQFAQASAAAAIVVELIEMAPSYLVAWLLINREALTRQSPSMEVATTSPQMSAFLERLPSAIGRDVVAVSSDLHYLQVSTTEGNAMILGSLKEVEAAYGSAGLRVHRSHWVVLDAVQRVRKGGSAWRLEMSNGQQVPVSRRKRTAVTDHLGGDFSRRAKETQNA